MVGKKLRPLSSQSRKGTGGRHSPDYGDAAPSVDVVTGTIKANFPRISFAVSSKVDSRTILGEMGAEQLLGMGDLLYMPNGGKLQRVHGPFASDEEVEAVVSYLKTLGEPDYAEALSNAIESGELESSSGAGGDGTCPCSTWAMMRGMTSISRRLAWFCATKRHRPAMCSAAYKSATTGPPI